MRDVEKSTEESDIPCKDCMFYLRYYSHETNKGWCFGKTTKPPKNHPKDVVKFCLLKGDMIDFELYLTVEEAYDLGFQLSYFAEMLSPERGVKGGQKEA